MAIGVNAGLGEEAPHCLHRGRACLTESKGNSEGDAFVLARVPLTAGTRPLGLDVPGSGIDVLCFAPDVRAFTDTVWHNFSDAPAFMAKQWVDPPRSVVGATLPLNGDY